MSNCIVRFGGNSLANKPVIQTFVKLLAKSDKKTSIVVSAIPVLQKVISRGIESLRIGLSNTETIYTEISKIVENSLQFLDISFDKKPECQLKELNNLLKGIELTGDYSISLKDQVNSYAEIITAIIIEQLLLSRNVKAKVQFPNEIGLQATLEYGNANVLFSESGGVNSKLTPEISIIPGSFGINSDGKVSRFGIQSADYTAAALVKLLNSDSLELWEIDKEFRTSDNNYISESTVIPRLTYSEASELSYFSHSSIDPRIVEPLIDDHIPVKIFRLENGMKTLSTIINSESFISENIVKSVVHTEDIAILKLNGPGVGYKPGILAKVTTAFHLSSINIRSVITSQVSINIILNKSDISKAKEICSNLNLTSVSEIIIENKVSLIAIVGHGMQQYHGVSAKLFSAVANEKINVLLSGSGASDLVSYLIVRQEDTKKSLIEIHKIFFKDSF